jgi:hypothetical protein
LEKTPLLAELQKHSFTALKSFDSFNTKGITIESIRNKDIRGGKNELLEVLELLKIDKPSI